MIESTTRVLIQIKAHPIKIEEDSWEVFIHFRIVGNILGVGGKTLSP